jgi:hypothetical protein
LSNFNKKKEKKKNTSKRRGNGGELELSKVFCERFPDKKFFRSIGSGNRWSQVDLSEEMKNAFTGDIVCPTNFKFVIECKYGYADIEMCGIFSGHKQFDEWLKKVRRDADSLKKHPIVCWRKPHYEWLAFIPYELFLSQFKQPTIFLKYIKEEEWAIIPLNKLLELPNDFWFDVSQDKI